MTAASDAAGCPSAGAEAVDAQEKPESSTLPLLAVLSTGVLPATLSKEKLLAVCGALIELKIGSSEGRSGAAATSPAGKSVA